MPAKIPSLVGMLLMIGAVQLPLPQAEASLCTWIECDLPDACTIGVGYYCEFRCYADRPVFVAYTQNLVSYAGLVSHDPRPSIRGAYCGDQDCTYLRGLYFVNCIAGLQAVECGDIGIGYARVNPTAGFQDENGAWWWRLARDLVLKVTDPLFGGHNPVRQYVNVPTADEAVWMHTCGGSDVSRSDGRGYCVFYDPDWDHDNPFNWGYPNSFTCGSVNSDWREFLNDCLRASTE